MSRSRPPAQGSGQQLDAGQRGDEAEEEAQYAERRVKAPGAGRISGEAPADEACADEARDRPGGDPTVGGAHRLQVSHEDGREEPQGEGAGDQGDGWEGEANVATPRGFGLRGSLDAGVSEREAEAKGEPAQQKPTCRYRRMNERDPRSARWRRHGTPCLPEGRGL